ncbi:MAG: peptide-methionine (S)-S-oxide reductase MsrA [Chloroflexi bacterium]|nr:peptide-methionine (S)-S-oxide reductase MsrA [Chloroflexota bacterium]
MNDGHDAAGRQEIATLGGGCFWCIEAIYNDIRGVNSAVSGYAGGHAKNPTYQQVCEHTTGHAEAVQIAFNPDVISYRDVLDIFFSIHDPTTLNRQGNDVGDQYRSVVFYHDAEQKRIAQETIKALTEARAFKDPIVTQVEPFQEFYPAEAYHQEYYKNNPSQPYCRVVIALKVNKFRKSHAEMLKHEGR